MSNVWLGGNIVASGQVVLPAGQQSIVLSNALIIASSTMIALLLSDDATAKSVVAICAAGQVTFKTNAAATGAVQIGFALLG